MTDAPRTPALALVIPIHGNLPVTQRFLASFQRQSVRCGLTFVDDASPDGSAAWLREQGWDVQVPARRLWYNGIVNWAIASCEAPYLGILNNDLVLGRDFVAQTISSLDETSFDLVVPKTLANLDQEALDCPRRRRIVSLWRQQGWCMILRVASFRRLPTIPEDLRLWYGDTWLFHHAWSNGLKVGMMRHVWVFHERGATVGGDLSPAREVIEQDQEAVRLRYPWLAKKRPLGRLRLIPRPLRRYVLPHIP